MMVFYFYYKLHLYIECFLLLIGFALMCVSFLLIHKARVFLFICMINMSLLFKMPILMTGKCNLSEFGLYVNFN